MKNLFRKLPSLAKFTVVNLAGLRTGPYILGSGGTLEIRDNNDTVFFTIRRIDDEQYEVFVQRPMVDVDLDQEALDWYLRKQK